MNTELNFDQEEIARRAEENNEMYFSDVLNCNTCKYLHSPTCTLFNDAPCTGVEVEKSYFWI